MNVPSTPAPPGALRSMFRSILREQNTPGSGRSVRWGARNAFRTITPETSANSTEGALTVPSTPLLEHEEHTSFLDRLRDDSNDSNDGRPPSGREKIEQLAALGQSVGSRLASGPSVASAPPAPLSKSMAPIPRPQFGGPWTSSPLSRDDSSLSLPHSMSPAQDYSVSHRPFDMSRELDAIPMQLGNDSMASTTRGAALAADQDTRYHSDSLDVSRSAAQDVLPSSGPNETAAGGMTTRYPPGMFNLTKTQQRIPSFSIDPDSSAEKTRMSGERTRASAQTRTRDTTGSSSLDFITASAGSRGSTPGPGPVLDAEPSPGSAHARSQSLSMSGSRSRFLSRATTTAPPRELLEPTEITAQELPTLYPPGYAKFNQTTVVQVDPENIPELSRFFTPMLGEEDTTRLGLGHESHSNQDQTGITIAAAAAEDIPLPISPPTSLSGSTSSTSSLPAPADLTALIESQYKADLAAHAALVPILLSRAESAESNARRLTTVVKQTRGRVRELEALCIELGEQVGVLREEREWVMNTERTELVGQVSDRSGVGVGEEDEESEDKIELSGEAIRDIDEALRRAEIEAGRSRRRKDERDAARNTIKDLERRLREMEIRERDWEVRVERERDGQGARERVQVEKQGWERERIELLDRCVRAEKALADLQSGSVVAASGGAEEDRLRRELENYKSEVNAQWKYAEQADEKNRRLEEEIKVLKAQVKESRASSPRGDVDWRAKEAEWKTKEADWKAREAEWERERQEWVPTHRYGQLQTQIADLQAEREALAAQAGDMDRLETELENMAAELDKADSEMAVLTDRARHAEEMYVAAQKEVERAEARVQELENRSRSPDQRTIRRLELEKEEMLDAVRDAEDRLREMEERAKALEARCAKAEEERKDVLRDRAELEDELEKVRVKAEDGMHIEQERNALAAELRSEQEAHAALAHEHEHLVRQFDEIERERQVALENQQRLEGVVRTRNQEIADVEERLLVQSREAEQLRAATRELEKVKIQRDDAIQAEEHLRAQLEGRQSVEVKALRDKVAKLTDETSRLQRRVNELKAESADKEVKIVQLHKARALEAEDREGLNVALQAKQQELELIKRKLGVRGTAGATPAPGRVARLSSTRRESLASSAAFETPLPRAALALRDAAPPPPSDSTASVLSSSVSSNLHSISTNPLQTSTRANIYDAMSSTPATVKPVRSSLRGFSSLSVSGIRGVHFAPSESSTTESGTEDADVTIRE